MERAPKGGIGILFQRHIRELSRSLQRTKMYKQKWGLWLSGKNLSTVNYRNAIPCRNSFRACVAQKFGLNRNSFHMNPITKSNQVFCQPRHLCAKLVFYTKSTGLVLSLVLVEQALCINLKSKNRQ